MELADFSRTFPQNYVTRELLNTPLRGQYCSHLAFTSCFVTTYLCHLHGYKRKYRRCNNAAEGPLSTNYLPLSLYENTIHLTRPVLYKVLTEADHPQLLQLV